MAHLYFSLFLFLTFLLRQTLGQVLQNKTFDDSDSAVRYFGDWRKSAFSELDEGGGHMVTGDPNAQASFEFTGESPLTFTFMKISSSPTTRGCRLFPVSPVALRRYNPNSIGLGAPFSSEFKGYQRTTSGGGLGNRCIAHSMEL